MTRPRSRRLPAALLVLAAVAAAAGPAARAQPAGHAHAHGRMRLDVAIDDGLVVLRLDSPLDNLLGFERAPRTDAERQRVRQARERLSDPAALFAVDPAAGCRPAGSELHAPVLGWTPAPARPGALPAPAADAPGGDGDHGDLAARYAFRCADAGRARFIDLPLFDAFPRLRAVEAQVAAPQGQFRRGIARPARRLAWGR